MPISLTEHRPGVAELALDGPINPGWIDDLRTHAATLAAQPDLRAVRIVADGPFFCPGGDLIWMEQQDDLEPPIRRMAHDFHDGVRALAALDAPVLARVHAVAAGGGLSLVLGADMAIAGASATFTVAYTAVGLSPDGGGSWLLPRIVGRRRALELAITNRRVGAEEAERLGIITCAVPDDELDAEFDALVAKVASGPTAAFGAVKRLLALSSVATFDEQLDAEAEQIAQLAGSPTGQEGIGAFLAKRRPEFAAA